MENDVEKREHFKNAYSNYLPILALKDSEIGKKLIKADEGLEFPETVQDILDYLGNIEPLELDELQKNEARETLKALIARYGVEEVWKSRFRYKLEIEFIKNF